MKYIFFTLLIVNLGFAGYQYFVVPPVVKRPPANIVEPSNQRIQLLSEAAPGNQQTFSEVFSSTMPDTEVDSGSCLAIGPFQEVFKAQEATNYLDALELGFGVRAIDHPDQESDFRVMIPPLNSPEEAFRLLRELKSQNFDSYVITQGDEALGISLGVFSNQASARQTLARVAAAGYTPEIREIPRLIREFWLVARESGMELNAEIEASLLESHPKINFLEKPCSGSN